MPDEECSDALVGKSPVKQCRKQEGSDPEGRCLPCFLYISESFPRYPNNHIKHVLSIYRNTKLQLVCFI